MLLVLKRNNIICFWFKKGTTLYASGFKKGTTVYASGFVLNGG